MTSPFVPKQAVKFDGALLQELQGDDDVAAAGHILRILKPGGAGAVAVWKEKPWHVALENAHYKTRGSDESMEPFLTDSWYKKERLAQVGKDAVWNDMDVKFVEKTAWLNLGPDLKRLATIAWTFLATPVGGWQQRGEDKWEEAVDSMVQELEQGRWHKVKDGIYRTGMIADVAIMMKSQPK